MADCGGGVGCQRPCYRLDGLSGWVSFRPTNHGHDNRRAKGRKAVRLTGAALLTVVVAFCGDARSCLLRALGGSFSGSATSRRRLISPVLGFICFSCPWIHLFILSLDPPASPVLGFTCFSCPCTQLARLAATGGKLRQAIGTGDARASEVGGGPAECSNGRAQRCNSNGGNSRA